MKKATQILQKKCKLCEDGVKAIDYKDIKTLQRFVSGYGKIDSRRRSGNCMKHQRMVGTAIKRARIVALIPFVNR